MHKLVETANLYRWSGHVEHAAALVQVAQLDSHGAHEPLLRKEPAAHEAQSVAVPAVQVAHDEWHAVHAPSFAASAYWFAAHCARTAVRQITCDTSLGMKISIYL